MKLGMKNIIIIAICLIVLGVMAYSAVGLIVSNISGVFKGIPDRVETFRIYENKIKSFQANYDTLTPAQYADAEKQMLYYQSKVAHYAIEFLDVLDKNNQLTKK